MRCYLQIGVSTSNLSDCESDGVHGTAVTEAVADIAPGVCIYLANPGSPGDLLETAEWMVEHGVVVINQSLTWTWDGPGDGTSPAEFSPLKAVDEAVSGGVTWVNAAGTSADHSWIGAFVDTDADDWLEFDSNGSEGNSVFLAAEDRLTAQARWDDSWGSAAIDLELYNSALTLVAFSVDEQSGGIVQDPYERLDYTPSLSDTYYLAIVRCSGAEP